MSRRLPLRPLRSLDRNPNLRMKLYEDYIGIPTIQPARSLIKSVSLRPFRFINLPLELRMMIYERYFVPETTHHVMDLNSNHFYDRHTGAHECSSVDTEDETCITLLLPNVPSALLRTNRQVRSEAQRFYNKAEESLDIPMISIHNPCHHVSHYLLTLFEIVYGAMRYFAERFTDGCTFGDVAKEVDRRWEDDNLQCRYPGCKDVAKNWAAHMAYHMVLRMDPVIRMKVSWPASVADSTHMHDTWLMMGFDFRRMAVEFE